jgi:hypothetical protein
MEFLLLWIDDLDDAVCALRHLAPKIVGLLFAIALFVGTTLVLSLSPQFTLVVAALVLSVSLFETVRRRRLHRVEFES